MSHGPYSISDLEEMLQGGAFRPDEELRSRLRAELYKSTVRSPFRRTMLAAALTIVAALILTGIVIAFSAKEKAANVVYGIGSVYNAGMVTEVNETWQVDDVSITVDWVYADWNQILVGYTAQSVSGGDEDVETQIVSAALSDGTVLTGGPTSGYGEAGIDSIVAAYDAPENVRGLDTVSLQLVLRAEHVQYRTPSETPEGKVSEGQPTGRAAAMLVERVATGGKEISVELSIPVTAGRIIEAGQTAEAGGYQLTLKQLVLAPSMTTAKVCFPVPDPVKFRDWTPFVTLISGGRRFGGSGTGYQTGEAYSCQRVEIQESVPLDREQYVFRVDELAGFEFHPGDIVTTDMLPEEQWRIQGPWVFTLSSQP